MGYLPIQTWDGVPPQPNLGWGTPQPELGWGTPPRPDWGTLPPSQTWDGVVPPTWLGYPPPPKMWTENQTEKSTFPHPSDAGGNYRLLRKYRTRFIQFEHLVFHCYCLFYSCSGNNTKLCTLVSRVLCKEEVILLIDGIICQDKANDVHLAPSSVSRPINSQGEGESGPTNDVKREHPHNFNIFCWLF